MTREVPPDEPLKTTVTDLIQFLARPHLHTLIFHIAVMADRPVRFQELLDETNVPRNTLATRLKEMVAAGLVERTDRGTNPPRVDYAPTQVLFDLVPAFKGLHAWCVAHELPTADAAA